MKKLIFAVLFLLLLAFPNKSFAEVIRSFDVNVVAHKDGTMDFTENINYDFEDASRHGIYRYIPLFLKVGNLYRIYEIKNVSVFVDGNSEQFSQKNENDQIYLKIGDPNRTITGPHVYKISYTVSNGIGSNFSDHDEIYWNMTGNGWEVPIEEATGRVTTDFGISPQKIICFTGLIGSKDQNCTVNPDSAKTASLGSGEGLTMVAVYQVGTFPKSILSTQSPAEKSVKQLLITYAVVWVVLNIFAAPALIIWYQKRKNKKRFGPPTVNFDIPKDEKGEIIRPAMAGTIDTARLDRDDVVATIFDLAIRKYLRLEEKKTVRSMLPDSTEQTIKKIKEADDKLSPYERKLYDKLFEEGDSVEVSSLRRDFYLTFTDMEKDVFTTLVNNGYYTKNPKIQKAFFYFFGVNLLWTLNIFLAIIFFFFATKLNGRTALGDEVDHRIDGLKLFLKSMDRNYKWQAEKFYVVEQMIPYAMALGFIDKFMDALKILKPDYKPTWYSGYSGSFFGAYAGFYSSMSSSIAPSSSSGAGGGGSSGGGGGGGGGGSW